ncbi:MAG: hypothetical protein RXR17_03870 [Sulfolobaceae archaeon]|jgi:hypothetical protein
MKRIIIAGGGIAGTIVANRLVKALSPEIGKGEVELVVLERTQTSSFRLKRSYIGG